MVFDAKLAAVLGGLLALPLVGIDRTLTDFPRDSSEISEEVVAAGKTAFRGCKIRGAIAVRAATWSVASIEAYRRTPFEIAADRGSLLLVSLRPKLLDDVSLGPAQIKPRTAKRLPQNFQLSSGEIAERLVSDRCWALKTAAAILSETFGACGVTEKCAVRAAAKYNGQSTFSGPNLAYQAVFRKAYSQFRYDLRAILIEKP